MTLFLIRYFSFFNLLLKSIIISVIAKIPITASKILGDDRNTSLINSGDCVLYIEGFITLHTIIKAVNNIYILANFLMSFIAL